MFKTMLVEDLNDAELGTDDAGDLLAKFAQEGNYELDKLRANVISPEDKKKARTWGIAEVYAITGKAMNTIRAWDASLPEDQQVKKDEKGRWTFTLDDINRIRDHFGVRYQRPAGSKAMILAISNFKGGVAKTTTTVHLAQKAAIEGLRVLVVDLDPQASTTFNLGPFIPDIELSRDDIINDALLVDSELIRNCTLRSYFPSINLIPSNLSLQELDIALPNPEMNNQETMGHPAFRLRNALEVIREDYDLILLDCGPNMASVSLNAMVACNGLIIPVPPQTYDHASFVMLCSSLSNLFKAMNKDLDYLRILITKHQGTTNKSAVMVEQRIRQLYGEYVMSSVVNTTAAIEKASERLSTVYDQQVERNSRDTYKRAVEILDAVNNEILDDIRKVWEKQAAEVAK